MGRGPSDGIRTTCRFHNCDEFSNSRGLCGGHARQRDAGVSLRPLRLGHLHPEVLSGDPAACQRCDLLTGGGLCEFCRREVAA